MQGTPSLAVWRRRVGKPEAFAAWQRLAGFTLVEMLVVITIIGLLIALLLPAVQAAREAARQAQCQNNLKQLSLACLNYESQHQVFPPSLYFRSGHTPWTDTTHLSNWAISVLPFLEQQALYDRFDLRAPISDSVNRTPRGTHLPVMRCPSDKGGRLPFNFSNKYTADGDNWARGNYGANGSLLGSSGGGMGPTTLGWTNRWYKGVMGANTASSLSDIYDGASNTILLAELRAGVSQYDYRGTWALNLCGASSIWQMGSDDSNGPNHCSSGADNFGSADMCNDTKADMGTPHALAECLSCCAGCGAQATTRSCHPNGVHTAFADGSIHFISNFIEKGTLWAIWPDTTTGVNPLNSGNFLTWQRLCASQDGLTLDSVKY